MLELQTEAMKEMQKIDSILFKGQREDEENDFNYLKMVTNINV